MSSLSILYTFFAIRHFVPMTIFMTPFLIERKKFTNKEIFNRITPFFFIASLISSLIGPIIVSYIGNKNTILLDTGLEIICYFIFYFMPERSFFLAILTGVLHGFVTSLGSLAKGILMEHKPDSTSIERMYFIHATIKKIGGVISSWFGQDLKFSTGGHQANLLFSFITLTSSFFICMAIPDKGELKEKKNLLHVFFSGSALAQIRKVYTNEVLFFSILNVIGSSLYICFAMYSTNIFIERKKNVDPSVFQLGRLLYTISNPLRFFSWGVIAFLSIFDGEIVYNPHYDKNTMIFGYIDGLAKLIALAFSKMFSLILEDHVSLHAKTLVATILVMIFTFAMGKTNSLMKSYIIFILGSASSTMSLLWAYSGFSNEKSNLHIILGMNLVASSIIHISVSYYTRWRNHNVNSKMFLYFYICLALLMCAIPLLFV